MQLEQIDNGNDFDFGRVSDVYAQYRDIYPDSLYQKLIALGVGRQGQQILDLGSGTAVLPLNLSGTGAQLTATDLSKNQLAYGARLAKARDIQNIRFKVCSAEDTGFEDNSFDAVTAVQCFHYFNAEKAADEIRRVLRPEGLFAKIFMDWLPFEDAVIAEMEQTVLRYNPAWSGGGFRAFHYAFPAWAEGRFTVETVNSYDTTLTFSKEAWLGRVVSCRGVGASLSEQALAAFVQEYRALLAKYQDPLRLKHQIHIELYRSTKNGRL